MDWMHALPWLAAAAGIAAAGAWLARAHALRHGLLDQPGERRSHQVPTPRGGGIGIAAAWLLACLVSGVHGWMPRELALGAGIGSLLVAGVGFIDDHRPFSAWWRLLAHIAAGLLLALGVFASGGAAWLALVAFVAVPVMVNVWNFMDGINGIATSQGALVAAGMAGLAALPLQPSAAAALLPAWLLCAACLGFLPFNFPRARIFLGDVGSGTLGAALAVLLVLLLAGAPGDEGPGLLALAVVLQSAFLVDAALTLAGRILRREQWWTPHVGHAYQRLAQRAGSHVPVTLAYAGWTAVAVLVALRAYGSGYTARLMVCAGLIAVATLAWRAATGAAREHKETP
ncbi:MAG TPA: glycosyl transferase [Luteimonas sp.]